MGNALTIADNTADIEFYDGLDNYGFRYTTFSGLERRRGSNYAGQISSGGPTYDDATPFKRKVYENFLGGLGQDSDNKVYGGTGVGGDDSKFFYGDCWSNRGGYLLPGMARNQVYNTISTQTVPVASTDGLNPNPGDEYEIPRGVIPAPLGITHTRRTVSFTTGASGFTLTYIRILVQFRQYSGITDNIVGLLSQGLTPLANYQIFIPLSTAVNFTGWKWLTLTYNTGQALAANTTYTFSFTDSAGGASGTIAAIGCYGGPSNKLTPYIQLLKSTQASYKWWANPLVKMEQLYDGSSFFNIGLTSNALLNTANTNSGGSTPATSPEQVLAGAYQGSCVFNQKLYVFTSAGVAAWSVAAAATNAAPTNANSAGVIGYSPIAIYGKIWFIGTDRLTIYTYDGLFPATGSLVVAADTIGQKGSPINNLFVFQGSVWVIKPEGAFQLYADPNKITTNPGDLARINQIGEPLPVQHIDTGKWCVQYNGSIYFNYRDSVCQLTPQSNAPAQVTFLALPIPWYRLSYYNYVNGLATDGVNLYVSWNNLGTYLFINQVWHLVTEFYEQVGVTGQSSGLRWLPNSTGGPDSLFVGDGRTILQIPIPSATAPYTQQIYSNHQNKCGYLITSATDMEQAEIIKFVQSVVLIAQAGDWCYKIQPVCWIPPTVPDYYGPNPAFSNLLTASFQEGLVRDNWVNPTVYSNTPTNIATTKLSNSAVPVANSTAPVCWQPTDFQNRFYSSEKEAATITATNTTDPQSDVLSNQPTFVKVAFIIYFWNPNASQQTTVGKDLMAIDSIIVKYQAIQDYISLYKIALSCQSLTEGYKTNLTQQQAEDTWEWLASQFGRHSPIRVKIKYRLTNSTITTLNLGNNTKTFYAMIQNPVDQTGSPIVNIDSKGPLPNRVDFELVRTVAEYTNV